MGCHAWRGRKDAHSSARNDAPDGGEAQRCSQMKPRRLAGLLTLLGISAMGCGPEVICASEGDVGIEGAPILTDFALVGQLEGDPWTIILSADFEDSDGTWVRTEVSSSFRWNVSSACTPSQ